MQEVEPRVLLEPPILPSRSTELSTISPAPSSAASAAKSSGSRLAERRALWVTISWPPNIFFLASITTTTLCRPTASLISAISSGLAAAAALSETFSTPSPMIFFACSASRMPPP